MPKPILFEPQYRSKLERRVAEQLKYEGIEYQYEPKDSVVRYLVPARKARYLPDFVVGPGSFGVGPIIIESKGWFKAKDRQKLALIKEQNPTFDIRLLFERANNKIYKDSPTTYAQWCDDHGFPWADKGVLPEEWIEDLRRANGDNNRKRIATKATKQNRSAASGKARAHQQRKGR